MHLLSPKASEYPPVFASDASGRDRFPCAALPSDPWDDGQFCLAIFPTEWSAHMRAALVPQAMGRRSICGSDPKQVPAPMGQYSLLID